MTRTQLLQEIRKMRFEEACTGWNQGRLTQADAAQLLGLFVDIADWAEYKEPWLRRFLALKNGVPLHDTLNRVFRLLDPKAFAQVFADWVSEVLPTLGIDAIALRLRGRVCVAFFYTISSATYIMNSYD